MARLNVYVSDELAVAAREAGLNVSALTQHAIDRALRERRTTTWLEGLVSEEPWASHRDVTEAVDAAKDELGD